MSLLRWHTTPQGATAALHAAMQVCGVIQEYHEDDLPIELVRRYDDFVAVLDEHFTFEDVEA